MDKETLTRIFHATQFRSRRQAKRILREAGGVGTAEELDRVLAELDRRDDAPSIRAAALSLQQRVLDCKHPPAPPPEQWIVGRGVKTGQRMLVHICPGGSWSFMADIVNPGGVPHPGMESYDLPRGPRLTNITWLDGGAPPRRELQQLIVAASDAILASLEKPS